VERVLEPELMSDAEQARQYSEADFSAPNRQFIALLEARHPQLPERGAAIDLGCGPGDITLRFATAQPHWTIVGVDGSPAMLALARAAVRTGAHDERESFLESILPMSASPRLDYDLILSNSLLHHLHRPDVLWSAVRELGRPGAAVLVMDLVRPDSRAQARALVDVHAASEPALLRSDFYHSLLAAFRPAEVAAQIATAGLGGLSIATVSDRHLAVWGTLVG
jgi:SAM-dependent methyltransferase